MRIDHTHRRVETGIRDAEDANFTVVVGDVFDEPIDRVVGIGVFVSVFGAFVGIEGANVNVLAFGAVAPADVLRDEDELILGESQERTGDVGGVVIGAVRLECVRGASKNDGPRVGVVFGNVNAREKVNAVAHGNAVFVFGIVFGEPDGVGVERSVGGMRIECAKEKTENEKKNCQAQANHGRIVGKQGGEASTELEAEGEL
jgi:hypothetical protein